MALCSKQGGFYEDCHVRNLCYNCFPFLLVFLHSHTTNLVQWCDVSGAIIYTLLSYLKFNFIYNFYRLIIPFENNRDVRNR